MSRGGAKPRVLITDYVWASTRPEREVLAAVGAEAVESDSADEDRLAELAADCVAIMTCFAKVTSKVIRSAAGLRIVARYGIGLDNIAVHTATELGIPVTNVPDYCIEEVADHTMALAMALGRGVVRLDSDVKQGGWDLAKGRPIHRLRGSVMGLLGYGRIGRSVAQRAEAFGMRVIVYDPYLRSDMFPAGTAPELVDMDEVLAKADFVSVHTPLTTETRHLVGANELRRMKPSAYLVNTCRGPVVDELALAEALNRGEIAGAGVDVLEFEPPAADHPLRTARNAILTPHAAFYSEESVLELQRRTAGCVADVLRGKVPQNVRNPEVLKSAGLAP